MVKFHLINPYIDGTLNTGVDVDTPIHAAKKIWKRISKYIVGEVPKFALTIKQEGGDLYHFSVQEKKVGDDVNFDVSEIKVKINFNIMDAFQKQVATIGKQMGGSSDEDEKKKKKKKDEDDEEEEEWEDIRTMYSYLRHQNPFAPTTLVNYWWYTPIIYDIEDIFIPIFNPPLRPYINIWKPDLILQADVNFS